MILPDLPRQLKKKEAKSSVFFRHWVENNKLPACTLEMKDTRGSNSFPFSEVTDEQIAHALAAKSDKGILIRNTGGSGEPDYTYHRNQPAYVVIRYPKVFHIIDIDTFLLEKKRSKRRSLLSTRAREISIISVPLGRQESSQQV